MRQIQGFFAIAIVCFAFTTAKGQLPGRSGRPVPFVQPKDYEKEADRLRRMKEGTRTMLRFGYLAENKEAEALRGRTVYNEQGNVLQESLQDFKGNPEKVVEIEWLPGGLKMKQFSATRFEDAVEKERFSWQFNESGEVTEFRYESPEWESFSEQFAWDENGNRIFSRKFMIDGTPGPGKRYEYDVTGRLKRIEQIGFADAPAGSTEFEYAGERVKTEIEYSPERVAQVTKDYAYDTRGRLISRAWYVTGGYKIQEETWTYNSRGDTLTYEMFMDGEEGPYKNTYKYNAAGQRTEYKSYDPDGTLFAWYQYAWDSTGTGAGWKLLSSNGSVTASLNEVFDAEGRILKRQTRRSEGRTDEMEIFKYDPKGRPLEHTVSKFGEEWAVYWFVFENH